MKTENLASWINSVRSPYVNWHNEDWAIERVNSPAKDRDLYLNEHTVTYRINPFLFAKVYLT